MTPKVLPPHCLSSNCTTLTLWLCQCPPHRQEYFWQGCWSCQLVGWDSYQGTAGSPVIVVAIALVASSWFQDVTKGSKDSYQWHFWTVLALRGQGKKQVGGCYKQGAHGSCTAVLHLAIGISKLHNGHVIAGYLASFRVSELKQLLFHSN